MGGGRWSRGGQRKILVESGDILEMKRCRVPTGAFREYSPSPRKRSDSCSLSREQSEVTERSTAGRVGVRRHSGDIAGMREDYVERGRWIPRAKQAEQRPIHLIHLRFEDTGLSICMQLVDPLNHPVLRPRLPWAQRRGAAALRIAYGEGSLHGRLLPLRLGCTSGRRSGSTMGG
jgi:hypothetical protein